MGEAFQAFVFFKVPLAAQVVLGLIQVILIIIGVFLLQHGKRHLKNSRDSSK